MKRQVLLPPNDITEFVLDFPAVVAQSAEVGQVTITDVPSLTGDNTQGFWDKQNPASPFYGADLKTVPIELYRDGLLVFVGTIQNIRPSDTGHTAEVTLRSDAQRALDSGVLYISGISAPLEEGTPADLALELCDLYKIQTDAGSFALSNTYYNASELRVRGRINSPGTTLLSALQALATLGTARVWFQNNVLYWQAYQLGGPAPAVTFSDDPAADECTILQRPIPEQIEKQGIAGYSVEWEGGTATFGLQDGAFSFSGGPESIFPIVTLSTAVWVGGQWLFYLNRMQERITFGVPIGYARELRLGDPVAIQHFGGGWPAPTTIDLVQIDTSTLVQGILSGVTR